MTGRVGGFSERPAGSLKEAQQHLVEACGGLDRCEQISRIGRSQIARCTSAAPEHETVHLPIDVIDCLEALCGQPIVTRWMTARHHALLVPLPPKSPAPYLKHLCDIGKDTGALFAKANDALADELMTPKEAGAVKREAMRLATGLAALMSRLDSVIFSGKADR